MALPTWPAGVPLELTIDTFSQENAEQIVETGFEDGPPRQRRRASSDSMIVSVGLALTPAELGTFETWHRATIFRGTSRFTGSVARPTGTSATKTMMIVGGGYTVAPLSGNFRVTFQLRIWDYYS